MVKGMKFSRYMYILINNRMIDLQILIESFRHITTIMMPLGAHIPTTIENQNEFNIYNPYPMNLNKMFNKNVIMKCISHGTSRRSFIVWTSK